MDVPEQRVQKLAAADTTSSPLVSAEKNNGLLTTRHPRIREVISRHKSPTPSTPAGPRRCQSPNPTRTTPTPVQAVEKRAVSAERKRPSTPSSPRSTSTPVHDSSTTVSISSRRLSTGRMPEGLWPSTMRSLGVSLQSDTISIPVSKKEKEKLVSNVSLDRTLRPPSDVVHRQQSETSTLSQKPNPERKRSLLEGKTAPDQSENAKPVGGLPSQLIDHHRWPGRIGGKLSSHSLNKSVDLGDTTVNNLSTPNPEIVSSLKRMPISDSSDKPLLKSSNDAARLISLDDIGRIGSEATSIDDKPRRASFPANILSASSLEKTTLTASGSRSQSPSKTSVSRGVSPHQARPSTPTPRGASPTRVRTSTSSSQSHSSTPILSSTPRVVSPTRMRTSTSNQSHSSTATSSSHSHSSTPRVVNPTPMRASTSSSQSHNSTSVLSSTQRVVSPTRMRTSTPSSQSHSSTSTSSNQSHSSTPRVVSPTRIRTSTSSSQYHSSTSVLSSNPRVVSPTRMRTSTSSTRTHSRSHSSITILSSTLRGVSPTPRAVSPTRMRTSTSSSESHSATSVLSFILDFTKERKSASQMEDAHQLCLLYNRYLQWRFANAHAETVLYTQKVNVEETMYNVWNPTLSLCDTLIKKRINLQRLMLELNLNSVLNHQMGYLDDWELLERDHTSSLAGAEEDLKASTLHLPITGGATADIESLKAAICSAVDVMHAMGSSICSLLPKVEGANSWVSELATIAGQEKNMLDQCEALLSSTATMQLEECSFRSQLMQTKQPLKKNKPPSMAAKTFPWP
ncbi:hypothetical protein V6N13_058306 [Hibiscus sabdariffa]|uniref:AUGMIN subunit 8 n=1 Tax=Hibiscus sabdariffa TaxID=183260 RepID=A0ABR2GH35_9ROSI